MSLGRNATYNLIGQAAPVVVALVTIPIYLRLIGTERYGVLAICWMLLGYFGLFDLGLTRATAHRIAAEGSASAEARARIFGTAVLISLALAGVGAALLYAGGRWYFAGPFELDAALRSEALQALPILALGLPGAILAGVCNGSLQGRERFLEVNLVGVATTTLVQIIPVLVAWLAGPRLAYLLTASVMVQLGSLAVSWVLCRRLLTAGSRLGFDRGEAAFLLRYGGWVSVSAVVGPIISMVDRFVIGAVFNATAVATYVVPSQLAQRSTMIPYSFATALFPRLSAERDPISRAGLTQQSTRAAASLTTPVVMFGICVMGPFLHLWLGGALPAVAVMIGQIVLLGWWANGIAIHAFTLIQASGRPNAPAVLHVIELPVYVALLWALTQRFGLIGAAAAFSLRCAVDAVALCAMAYGKRADLAIYAIPAALLIAAVSLVGGLTSLAAWVIAAASLAGAVLWSYAIMPTAMRQTVQARARQAVGWVRPQSREVTP